MSSLECCFEHLKLEYLDVEDSEQDPMFVAAFAIDFHPKTYHFVPTLDLEHMGLQEMEHLRQCDLDLRLLHFSGSITKLDVRLIAL